MCLTHTLRLYMPGFALSLKINIETFSVDTVSNLTSALRCWQKPGLHIIEAQVDRAISKDIRNTIRARVHAHIQRRFRETLDYGF